MGRSRKFEDPKLVGFKLEREEVEQLDRIIEELGITSRSRFLRKFSRSVIQKNDSVTVENQNTNFNLNMNIQQQTNKQVQFQKQTIHWMLTIVLDEIEEIESILQTGMQAEQESSSSKLAVYTVKKKQEEKLNQAYNRLLKLKEKIGKKVEGLE